MRLRDEDPSPKGTRLLFPFLVRLAAIALSVCPSPAWAEASDPSSFWGANTDLVDISRIEGVRIELRYASSNNLTGAKLYEPNYPAVLHKLAADKLRAAAVKLQRLRPGYNLLVLDASRPRSVQQRLWERVRTTDMKSYVSNPAKGSVHNFGFAVDITLADARGIELDMGTAFDTFSPLSHPSLEDRFLQEGLVSASQVANRRLLRSVMRSAGFRQHPIEWWHYDALPATVVRREYPIIE